MSHGSHPQPHEMPNPAAQTKEHPGTLGTLNVYQEAALETFRKELQKAGVFDEKRHDDAALLRFLRARKFDILKAKKMLIEEEEWRKEFGVDDLVQNFDYSEKAEVMKYYPQYYHKTDREGRPVYIEQLGKLDVKKLYAITTAERQLQELVVQYEKFATDRLPACSEMQGHLVETSCTIMDLKNVSISSFWSVQGYVKAASNVSQNYYPERMGRFFIINAPWMFNTVWAFVKPWLDEVTVSKITILGHDYVNELQKQIPRQNLPKEFGGLCQCPGGCELSDAGPWNPESLKWDEEQAANGHLQVGNGNGSTSKTGSRVASAANSRAASIKSFKSDNA